MNNFISSVAKPLSCLVLASLFLLTACKPTSINGEKLVKPKKKSPELLLGELNKKKLKYTWFTGKAKVKFENDKENVSFTANLRMKRDSIVWQTVKKVSVEGARIRITPEKIEILNHQDNEYTPKPFGFIKEQYQVPLSFQDLQEMLVGNPIYLDKFEFKSSVDGYQHRLDGSNNDMVLSLWLSADYQLEKLELKTNERSLLVLLSDYEGVGEQFYPTTIDINVDSKQTGKARIKISYNKVEIDMPAETPFEIPEHYKKIE